MAKRFGRNQRRAMREKLATKDEMLTEALNRSGERQREIQQLRARLTDWATEILYLMGSDSAFNEQLRRIATAGSFDRLHLSPVPAPITSRDEKPQWERVSDVITACILRCQIKSDDLRGQIAVEIGDHMGPLVAYGLPIERRLAWSPRDTRYIAELIANKMASHLEQERLAA